MPLTTSGRKVLRSMRKQYGKKRGTSVFYASINARKAGSSKWHIKRRIRLSKTIVKRQRGR